MIEAIWLEIARMQLAPWFERVATAANPADVASRLDFAALRRLSREPRVVPALACERRVLEVLERGGCG